MGPMADAKEPAKPSKAPIGSLEEVQILWDLFRAGGVVSCPVDQAGLALSVDAAANAYRFVCTRCGAASPWFESGPTGIQVRGQSPDTAQSQE